MKEFIGQKLQQARVARKLTLEQVSQATHMRLHYLEALEAGNFEALPSTAQARGFLRTYANYLGLDADVLLSEMNVDKGAVPEPEPAAPERTPDTPVKEEETASASGDEIFIEVGQRLKRQRETLGLSLEDIEHHTNLRHHYLIALEAGDLDSLPSTVQGRGMLNNYAVFLGMDPEPVLIRFAEGLQARLAAKRVPDTKARKKGTRRKTIIPTPMRRVLSSDFLIGGSVIIFLAVLVVWVAIRVFAMQTETTISPTAPSIVDVLLATSTPSPTLPSVTETPSPLAPAVINPIGTPLTDATIELPLSISNPEGVDIYIAVNQRAWVRITVDGEVELTGRVLPGSAYSFSGEEQIEILTGNGAAIHVFYNQEDQGRMGGYGKVVLWIFTRDGILSPTPTITPTPTMTPRATSTVPILPDVGTSIPPSP